MCFRREEAHTRVQGLVGRGEQVLDRAAGTALLMYVLVMEEESRVARQGWSRPYISFDFPRTYRPRVVLNSRTVTWLLI